MHSYVYHAQVLDLESADAVRFRLDLGFRVYADQWLSLADRPDGLRAGDAVHLIVSEQMDGRILARVYNSARDGWPPHLWRYPGSLIRVIDGDTLDVRVTIYPGLAIEERFRLARINAPEMHGRRRDDPEYIRGVAARDYAVARLAEHDGQTTLHTSRRGKWRRWLAEVYVGDATTPLSDELLRERLAALWIREPRRPLRTNGAPLVVSPELRDRIVSNADRLHLPPEELLERALTRYLE